jgi:NAD(P)-dependent dehydrogenase (short-subunit alcohol dehydrogenase family)
MPAGRLAGRVALITGASRGIGAAVARRFAAEGAHVVLVARTVAGLEEVDDQIRAAGGSATLVPLDLRDHDAIDRLGPALLDRYQRLDILVGNAGLLGTLTPLAQVKPAEWDELLDVNVTANWRLIRILDPLLRASPAGRAMFVTSSVGSKARAYWATYAVSKAALEMAVKVYAAEVEKTNLRVNLIDPGRTRTRMRAKAYPGEDPMTLKTPDEITDAFVALAEPACASHGETIAVQPARSPA